MLLTSLPPPAAAHGIIDQSYTPSTTGWNWIKPHMPIGQSFTPSKSPLLAVDVELENVLVTDQTYNPGFASPGVGYNWISFHTPIGQSFTPTLPILGAVEVGIFNDAIQDQSFDPGFAVGWNWVQAHQPIGQSFTPDYPQLWRVDLGLENTSGGPVSLTLNIRQGTILGPIVGAQGFSVPAGGPAWRSVYFTPYPGVTLTPGMTYVLDLVGAGPSTVRWYGQTPGGAYPGGTAITSGSVDPNGDYLFKTYGFGDKITMNLRSGTILGPVLATKTLSIPPMDTPIMMRFNLDSPILVTTGSTYVIELQQSPRSVRWYILTPGGTYPGGTAITDGSADPGGDYFFDTYGAGNSLTVNIRAGSIGGPVLGTAIATVPVMTPALFHVDLPTPIPLTLGTQYVIELQQSVQSMRWYHVRPSGAYVGGSSITSGTVEPDGDYIFRTYAPPGLISTSLSIILTPPIVDIGTMSPGTGTITASINPVLIGAPISISYSTSPAGPWALISTGAVGATGTYTVVFSPPATGTYYFRADFAGDSTYAPSSTISAPNSINVVPEFPVTAIVLVLAVGMSHVLVSRRKKRSSFYRR